MEFFLNSITLKKVISALLNTILILGSIHILPAFIYGYLDSDLSPESKTFYTLTSDETSKFRVTSQFLDQVKISESPVLNNYIYGDSNVTPTKINNFIIQWEEYRKNNPSNLYSANQLLSLKSISITGDLNLMAKRIKTFRTLSNIIANEIYFFKKTNNVAKAKKLILKAAILSGNSLKEPNILLSETVLLGFMNSLFTNIDRSSLEDKDNFAQVRNQISNVDAVKLFQSAARIDAIAHYEYLQSLRDNSDSSFWERNAYSTLHYNDSKNRIMNLIVHNGSLTTEVSKGFQFPAVLIMQTLDSMILSRLERSKERITTLLKDLKATLGIK